MKNIINKTRDAVELYAVEFYAGLARIGADMAKARVRSALGIPTLKDCDVCGGRDYTMRVRDGVRVCISCVEFERQDAARRVDMLEALHDESLAALSVAIQRAEAAEAEVDRTAKAHREELRAWVEAAAEETRECEAMMAERNEYYAELEPLREHVMRMAKWIGKRAVCHDHACTRCALKGDTTKDGYVCAAHLAREYLTRLEAES